MAKERRSLFERLTGSVSTNEEYEFEDIAREPAKGIQEIQEEPGGELAVDVYQTPTHIIIKAMIAGVKPEDLDISITRDMVTLKGKREQHTEVQSGEYFFQELYWGMFSRTLVLPQEVEIEEAEAVEKHGLLIIRLPKIDKGRQTKLKIKSS
ncbi:MAG TPA: Hsp20/alpha crystallin family protein [Candidatus Paceibacterota bacterium]